MVVLVIDRSSGDRSWRKSRRTLASVMFPVLKRVFVGSLSKRVFEQLLDELRKNASRSTALVVLFEKKSGYRGWQMVFIGSRKLLDPRWLPFLEFEK